MASSSSDHFDGSKFFNPQPFQGKTFKDFLGWVTQRNPAEWPEKVENKTFSPPPSKPPAGQLSYTLINHATVLIQVDGLNIITDPHYSQRASPVQWAGPKRIREPGVPWEKLPKIDLILLSHNHYDHMDEGTLKRLAERDQPVIVTGLNNGSLLRDWGFKQVHELDWDQKIDFAGLEVFFVRAQHFSARGLFDRDKTLWGGFMVKTSHGFVFFAGDTGYGEFYKEFPRKYSPVVLSLIPIGAYEPRWFMGPVHTNPAEALQIHKDLQSRHSLGVHWGTFPLTDEAWDAPKKDLATALMESPLNDGSRFLASDEGETVIVHRK